MFKLFSLQVNCVVLNACYSEIQAKAIAQHIPFVIGMNDAIGDKAAIAFAVGFYKALAANRSIEDAYKFGCVEIQLQGIPEHLQPVIYKKPIPVLKFDSVPEEEAQVQSPRLKKILILSANPTNTNQLRLDEEVREIEAALERSRSRDRFQIISKWAVRSNDLRRALLDYKPEIVHFSGHGAGSQGLALENNSGQIQLVKSKALAGLFELFDSIECVLLNACYNEAQAEAIAQHVDYVIGMNRAIGDRAAIEFAVAFYDALGADRSYEDAYEFGCVDIALGGISASLIPVLKARNPHNKAN
nr:CHAT domain-containing protein [Hassalia byssoidea]